MNLFVCCNTYWYCSCGFGALIELGTGERDFGEPVSVYSRRRTRTSERQKSKGKEVAGYTPISFQYIRCASSSCSVLILYFCDNDLLNYKSCV